MSHLENRKVKEGLVVGHKTDKTAVISVETRKVHPLYKKAMRVTKKYMAHDDNNACKVGDKVKIIESRPLSKKKKWRVTEIMPAKEVIETGSKG